jgi:hypothetical protein
MPVCSLVPQKSTPWVNHALHLDPVKIKSKFSTACRARTSRGCGTATGVQLRAPCPVCGIPVQLAFSHHHHHWYPTRAALVLGLSLRALGTGHWFWLGRCNRRILPPPPFLRPYFFSFHSCWHTSFNLSSTYNCRYNTKRLRALTEDNTSTRLRREKKEILGADRTSCWVSQANVPSDRGILILGEPIRTASPNRQPGIQQVSNHSGSSETSISARPSR